MRYIALLICIFLHTGLIAQVQMGLEMGLNAGAPMPKKISKGSKGKLGINPVLGIGAHYKLNKRLSLQGTLYYDRKSADYTSPVQYDYIVVSGDSIDHFSGIVTGAFRNSYLTFPVHIRYTFNRRWSAGGGGYASYLLKGSNKGLVTNGKAGYNGIFTIDDQQFDESSNIHRLDLGLNTVVRYQLRQHISIQWLLAYGITSVTRSTINFKDKIHNSYTYLTIGYGF